MIVTLAKLLGVLDLVEKRKEGGIAHLVEEVTRDIVQLLGLTEIAGDPKA